jgi:YbbR domain-containing protein
MRLLKWLGELVTQNPGWKLLSLGIAVVLWALVASEPELSTFATVGVEYKNLPENLEISSDLVSSVRLELSGPSGSLRGLGDGSMQPEVVLDMTGVEAGERTFEIGDGNVKLPRGVRMVAARPPAVRFRFERSDTRTVPIKPRFANDQSNSYAVTQVSASPSKVEIAGPASRVAKVSTALTDEIDVPSRAGTFEYRVSAYLEDPQVRFVDVPQVTVTVTVQKK